ncbi:MAG: two-component system, NarL family, nitrate/nitrite response regulator NarL [Thermoleophilaceae bacterium]|nr:two-component system, NarL family, nitrate/nitrite response regulator NarL [Thermoleophilaceae bacterium]
MHPPPPTRSLTRAAATHPLGNGRATVDERIQTICRTALDALVVVDDRRRFVGANGAAAKLYRMPTERLLGCRLDDFSADEHLGILSDLWFRFQRDGRQDGHYELVRADGSRAMVQYRATRGFNNGEHLIAIREIAVRPGLRNGLWAQRARMSLSPRELEVLQLVAEGRSAPEIGEILFVSAGTVKTHLKNIYGKLGARDRASAVAAALRRGMID